MVWQGTPQCAAWRVGQQHHVHVSPAGQAQAQAVIVTYKGHTRLLHALAVPCQEELQLLVVDRTGCDAVRWDGVRWCEMV